MLAHATGIRARRPRRGGGFTLIELVMIIIIVGILAATAIPALDSMDEQRGAMAARLLQRDLTYARQHALATGSNAWVVFDTAAETWTLYDADRVTEMIDVATSADYVQTLDVDKFAGIGVVSAAFDSDVEIGFDWLGEPMNQTTAALTADGVVTLTGGYTVTVRKLTGIAYYTMP